MTTTTLLDEFYAHDIETVLRHCETAILPLRTILYWGLWVWATQVAVVSFVWWVFQ